jgi:hypothetical protein
MLRNTIRRRRISLFTPSFADLLRRPPEACAVAPQAMQDDPHHCKNPVASREGLIAAVAHA